MKRSLPRSLFSISSILKYGVVFVNGRFCKNLSPFVGIWINLWPGHCGLMRQTVDVKLGLGVGDELEVLSAGAAQHLLDLADLVQVVFTGKHGLVVDHLSQDAAHTPDVESLAVTLIKDIYVL